MKALIALLALFLVAPISQQAQVIRTNLARRPTAPTVRIAPASISRMQISRTNLTSGATRIDPSKLRVFTRDAQEWKTVDAPVTSDTTAVSVPTITGRSTIAVAPQASRQALSSKPVSVPFFIPSAAAANSELVQYRVELHVNPAPARWNAESSQFETDVLIGVFTSGARTRAPLRQAVQLDFLGEEADLKPNMLVMTNTAEFLKVRAIFPRNDVEARMDVLPFTEDAPLVLPVRRMKRIKGSISPKVIMGFGLGTAQLTVSRLDGDDRPLNEGQELEIHLDSELARIGSIVKLPAGKSTTTHSIRSNGLGNEKLIVDYAGSTQEFTLKYVAPSRFLYFALAGGFVGGATRWLLGMYKSKKGSQHPEWWRCLLEGIIAGVLITAAASAIVVTTVLPASVLETELAALLLSVAGGLSGVQGVKAVYGKIISVFQSEGAPGRRPSEA